MDCTLYCTVKATCIVISLVCLNIVGISYQKVFSDTCSRAESLEIYYLIMTNFKVLIHWIEDSCEHIVETIVGVWG